MLNNFSSYFEIFSGLNLAYAGSEGFRNAVDNEILRLKDAISSSIEKKIEQTNSTITVSLSEENEDLIKRKINKIRVDYNNNSDELIKTEKEKTSFTEGFKAMFLSTALFCLSIIIIGGYEQYLKDNESVVKLFLLYLLPIFLFNLNVFRRSFGKNNDKKIKPITTIFFVLILFILSFLTLWYCPYQYDIEAYFSEEMCITFSLIIAISPYLLHFLRVFMHKTYYRYKFKCLNDNILKDLKDIEKWIDFTND